MMGTLRSVWNRRVRSEQTFLCGKLNVLQGAKELGE